MRCYPRETQETICGAHDRAFALFIGRRQPALWAPAEVHASPTGSCSARTDVSVADSRVIGRGETNYDPGTVRYGRANPVRLTQWPSVRGLGAAGCDQAHTAQACRIDDGNRQMVDVLTAVLSTFLPRAWALSVCTAISNHYKNAAISIVFMMPWPTKGTCFRPRSWLLLIVSDPEIQDWSASNFCSSFPSAPLHRGHRRGHNR